MEFENNTSICHFLKSTCLPGGRLGHSVYRKLALIRVYAFSHHHPSQKNSVLNSLVPAQCQLVEQENLKVN